MPQLLGRTTAAALVLSASVALAGCAPASTSTTTPPQTSSGGTASATPSATPTPTEPPTPVAISCDQLVTPDQVYAFNPNFGASPDYAPAADSMQKRIVDWKGVACGWQNQTSGDVIQIAVARPPAGQLESLKNQAITIALPVPTYGTPPIEGYFKAGDAGQVQIFRGDYWIVAESTAFFEPGDAAPLMTDLLANLPAE